MAITYDPTTADIGSLDRVPAPDLVIDPNVRRDIRLDKSFISSIRVYGFEQYPVGWRDDDGKVHITVGQRRTSAALEIGWPVVPIVVKPRAAAEHDRTEELRILAQLTENEQRLPLTEAERAGGYKQLALLGVSEDQIARKTNSPKARVKTGLVVAESPAASGAAEKLQLTLEQAATYTEFDGDDAAIAELDETAARNPNQLEHTAERLRNARLDAAVIGRLEQKIRDADADIVTDARPADLRPISELWRADDPDRTRLTLAKAKKYSGLMGRASRLGWKSSTGEDRGHEIVWFLTGWKEQGLTTYGDRQPLTDDEKAARKQKRIDKADMIAATAVRRRWITDTLLAAHHKLDQDSALRWIARELWHAPGTLRSSYGIASTLAFELLGQEERYGDHTGRNLDTGEHLHGSQAQTLTLLEQPNPLRTALALAIAQTESITGDPKGDKFGQDTRTATYLRQLRDWGYVLSDVEQRIVDAADTNAATIEGATK